MNHGDICVDCYVQVDFYAHDITCINFRIFTLEYIIIKERRQKNGEN